MIIRIEQPGDAGAVDAVVVAAFAGPGEAQLVRQLNAGAEAVISLVAELDGAIVGHVLFSRMTAPFAALALAPVSVAPVHQREGIGAALVRRGLDVARDAGWAAVFVLGDPAYYTRFGFDVGLAAGFASPYAGPHFMALPLAAALPVTHGELRHAAAFAALG